MLYKRMVRQSYILQPHGITTSRYKHLTTSRPLIQNVTVDEANGEYLNIKWSDGLNSLYPAIYLRDNCIDYKTLNGQRLFETYRLNTDESKINGISITSNNNTDEIEIKWNDLSSNRFSGKWLFENSCNENHRKQRVKESNEDIKLWDNTILEEPSVICSYPDIEQHKISIYSHLRKYGLCLINNAPIIESYDNDNNPPVISVGNSLGFVRSTNYGQYFDVRSVAKQSDCINLAYTTSGLSVHTDNPYRNPTPGIQLLHCINQCAFNDDKETDGSNILMDGFKIANDMKEQYPMEYELLSTIKRPFTYYDLNNGYKFHKERYVIGVDDNGDVESIHFNNRSASCNNWNIDENKIMPYYTAWKLFGKLADDHNGKYAIKYRLKPGEILIFNNNRVLHGRNGYIDGDLSRHLQGCYIDVDTVWARLDGYQHINNIKEIENMQ